MPADIAGLTQVLERVCEVDSSLLLGWHYKRFVEAVQRLSDRGIPGKALENFREYWDSKTYLGKQGAAPRPEQVCEEWVRYTKWQKSHKPQGPKPQQQPCSKCGGTGYVPDFASDRMTLCECRKGTTA